MASYQAKIDVIVGGIRELAALEGRLEQIQNIASALKRDPIDLNIGGRGKSRDLSGRLSKEINDVVRSFTNGERKLGSSVSSINQQASLFRDVLSQTALKGNSVTATFQKQDPIVRQLVTVYTSATEASKNFELQQRNVIRTSQGLQTEIQREIQLIQRRTKVARLREQKRARQEALSSGIVGGAFPLLFGGGLGASLFGGLGGAAGGALGGQFGLGLSLVGSAVGQSVDNIINTTAELGRALSIVNPDVDKIVESLGIAGTKTEAYIKALQDVGKESEAASFAAAKLEELVGSAGVNALQQFGNETQELTNEFQKLFTQLQAGIAQLITQSGVLRSAVEGVGRVVNIESAKAARGRNPDLDAALDALAKEQRSPLRGLEGAGVAALIPQGATEAEKKVLEEYNKLLRESGEIVDANTLKQQEKAAETEKEVTLARLKLEVERGNNNLLNQSVVDSLRAIAVEETRLELIAAQGDARAIELALLNASIKKLQLDNRIAAARARAASIASKGTKSAESAARKEAQIQKAIVSEKLKQFDLDTKLSILLLDKKNQTEYELSRLEERTKKQREVITLSTEDARLQEAKLDTLQKQADLRREELKATLDRLAFEKELQALRSRQETAGIALGLGQELTKLQLPTGNAFDDERIALLNEQANRYVNTLMAVNNELAIQQKILEDPRSSEDAKVEAEARNKTLKDQKAIYEEMLPAIAAAEREQLAYNQALSLVQGPVNSLVSGLQAVIDGTKTAEEAFADFLRTIADQLMQAATQMIAQYIALGIARSFAFGGPAQSVGSFGNVLGQLAGRANGGPVSGGTPYIVGERGPELFVPSNSGTVVPNNALGGNVSIVVNVTEGQTDARGGDGQANQLGKSIAAAVQSELIKQKRPGGLLAR